MLRSSGVNCARAGRLTAAKYVAGVHGAFPDFKVARSGGRRARESSIPLPKVSSSEIELDDDLALAHRLADLGRRIALARFGGALQERTKADGSLVTDADEAVEDALRAVIREERPNDAVLGEERGESGSGARRWIIDGIDGTVLYAQGRPEWGILLALEVEGRVVVGVCDQPARDCRYWAASGSGAYRRDSTGTERRLHVTTVDTLSAARSVVPFAGHLMTDRSRQVARDMSRTTTTSLPDEPAAALYIAEGLVEAAVVFLSGPWDLAAPSIVVEEAGGRFSDLAGTRDLTTGTGVFTNGRIHEALLHELART
jgi:histidinol-phosphatase